VIYFGVEAKTDYGAEFLGANIAIEKFSRTPAVESFVEMFEVRVDTLLANVAEVEVVGHGHCLIHLTLYVS